jgi:tripartite-type tricarboxylate transporter receptor subunit TctC
VSRAPGAAGIACAALAAALGCSLPAPDARADESRFYAGKQMQFIVRSEAGSGYDQYARLLGRYLTRHIPGAPNILVINMLGGGGLTAANFVGVQAPRDGTVLTMMSQGLPTDQALGLADGLRTDMNAFNWIGNLSKSNQALFAWHGSPVHSLHDAIAAPAIFGTTGAGSIAAQVPAAFNRLIGTQFHFVFGYPSSSAITVAMERGEVHVAQFALASLKAFRPDFVAKKLVTAIAQIGLEREAELPDTPLMSDLARTPEDAAAIAYISKAVAVGRPVATTPGAPPERVAILRRAFDEALADPDFNADAARGGLEISPMSGEQLQSLIHDLIAAPPDVLARVRDAMTMPDATTRR